MKPENFEAERQAALEAFRSEIKALQDAEAANVGPDGKRLVNHFAGMDTGQLTAEDMGAYEMVKSLNARDPNSFTKEEYLTLRDKYLKYRSSLPTAPTDSRSLFGQYLSNISKQPYIELAFRKKGITL